MASSFLHTGWKKGEKNGTPPPEENKPVGEKNGTPSPKEDTAHGKSDNAKAQPELTPLSVLAAPKNSNEPEKSEPVYDTKLPVGDIAKRFKHAEARAAEQNGDKGIYEARVDLALEDNPNSPMNGSSQSVNEPVYEIYDTAGREDSNQRERPGSMESPVKRGVKDIIRNIEKSKSLEHVPSTEADSTGDKLTHSKSEIILDEQSFNQMSNLARDKRIGRRGKENSKSPVGTLNRDNHEAQTDEPLYASVEKEKNAGDADEDIYDNVYIPGVSDSGVFSKEKTPENLVDDDEWRKKSTVYVDESPISDQIKDYETLYDSVTRAPVGYSTTSVRQKVTKKEDFESSQTVVYEDVNKDTDRVQSDISWGSSEFESYSENEDDAIKSPTSPISTDTIESHRVKPGGVKRDRAPSDPTTNQNVIERLYQLGKLKAGYKGSKREAYDSEEGEDENLYMHVKLNQEKHPPPLLPAPPPTLNSQQLKRRHIVASVVESENSYVSSLRRLVEEYLTPLEQSKPSILSSNTLKCIFYKIRGVLHCHNMFQIELAETVKKWDEDETIGNVFTASFSKSMVFEVYSAYVNNFSVAWEALKKSTRDKQQFADFLNQKQRASPDKLSIFGLMVKPVQRFPQFILLLQDLLKYTPREHHDRLPLQVALTELENLAHRLNEKKRESEQRHAARQVLANMGRTGQKAETAGQYLVRQDDLVQLEHNQQTDTVKTKSRRLFLLNDMLICATVIQKESDSGPVEKLRIKWNVTLKDVEVINTTLTSKMEYTYRGPPGRSTIVLKKHDQDVESQCSSDLDDMMHDLPLIIQIGQLASQLRLPVQGLSQENINSKVRELQGQITLKDKLDTRTIQLSMPARGGRVIQTMQTVGTKSREAWIDDFYYTKLALGSSNKPAWSIPEPNVTSFARLPLFMNPLPLNITEQYTQISCAVPLILPMENSEGMGVPHMWVCSGDESSGQVSIVSFYTTCPRIVESFKVTDSRIVSAELVPGHDITSDTIWMATSDSKMSISHVESKGRHQSTLTFPTQAPVVKMLYMRDTLFAGMDNGSLAVYRRTKEDVWDYNAPELLELGSTPVTCLLAIDDYIYISVGNNITIYDISSSTKHETHSVGSASCEVCHMVRAGVGLWVSMKGESVLRLYHLETFQHLQDINIASAVHRVISGQEQGNEPTDLGVTSLLSSRGLLWIGTSCGLILTLPLPRLEGVPLISGRPNVSLHGHCSSVVFLAPIYCGVIHDYFPLKQEPVEDLEEDISYEKGPDESPCETVSNVDTRCLTLSDNAILDSRTDLSNDISTHAAVRSRSLPHLLNVEDEVSTLYGCLMQNDIVINAMQRYSVPTGPSGTMLDGHKSTIGGSTKHSSIMEECPIYEGQEEEEHTPGQKPISRSVSRRTVKGDILPGGVSSKLALAKSVVIVSGGDGHVNWNTNTDVRYEDILLLMWQFKQG
ncbi:unnamed protein product [Owenia fusiformis]|uniref:DH domain-containing protein n=1 Tax=Owenia fusiformis TaxID=6347 RepID=A0A8S4N137_OWEFU|nr:unnamed protein product [Owenia fusiformis]